MSSLLAGRGRGVLVALGWTASAVAAIVVGLTAVDALGSGLVEPASQPLTASEVAAQLAAASATASPAVTGSPTPSPPASGSSSSTAATSTPSSSEPAIDPFVPPAGAAAPADSSAPASSAPPAPPPSEGGTEVTPTDGGTVVSRCLSGLATLESVTPAQGFAVENLERGPDESVGVRFESERTRVDIEVTCAGDEPQVDVETDPDR